MSEVVEQASGSEMAARLDRNFRLFHQYNASRVTILRRLTPPDRSLLLQAIPFLFQVNDRRIPGFVEELGENTGVHGFKPSDDVRNVRKAFFPKQTGVGAGVSRQPMVDSIASIGSAGTLAQTDHSDFDLWIVCRDDIPRKDYGLMGQKAELIKAWLMSMDPELDLNFYLATPGDVRRHHFGAVSDDSAGSALGTFLKEEFYRTCVVWMGKYPFWWICPSEQHGEQSYSEWLNAGKDADLPFMSEVMDMGPLVRSSPEKFLSAVLWQTNKSLKSPFKSLLKLTVVSRYGDEPDGRFLAEIVRKNVVEDTTFSGATDPYLCLFEFCAQYWRSRGDEAGVRLMAEMFFMKMLGSHGVGGAADADINDPVSARRRLAKNLLRDWGLSHNNMQDLSNSDKWGFERGLAYNELTQAFVKRIFERVMGKLAELGITFVDGKVVTLRDDVDPTVIRMLSEFSNISHKVDCFYGRSVPKVQPVPPSFRDILSQSDYTIVCNESLPRRRRWMLTEELPAELQRQQAENWGKVLRGETRMMTKKDLAPPPVVTDPAEAETEIVPATNPEPNTKPDAADSSSDRRSKPRGKVIQSAASMLTIVGWLCANRLAGQNSGLNLMLRGSKRPVRELRRLITTLTSFLRHKLYDDALPESTFRSLPKPYRTFVSFDLNQHSQIFGPQPKEPSSSTNTTRVATRKTVAQISELTDITILDQDTYGVVRVHEVPASRYPPAALMARILRRLEGTPLDQWDDRISFHAADTPFHTNYAKEFEGALKRAHQEFLTQPRRKNFGIRYLTMVGGHAILLSRPGEDPLSAREFSDIPSVLTALEQPLGMHTQTLVDPVASGPERLRSMFSRWKPGRVSIFVHRSTRTASLHVIDEVGAFWNERLLIQDLEPILAGLLLFVDSLNAMPLPNATRAEGRVPVQVFDVLDAPGSSGEFNYTVQATTKRPDAMAVHLATSVLQLSMAGSLDFTQPHRLEMRINGEPRQITIQGDNMPSVLAALLIKALPLTGNKDFNLIGFTAEDKSFVSNYSTVQFLTARRNLDRAVRRAIADTIRSTQVIPK